MTPPADSAASPPAMSIDAILALLRAGFPRWDEAGVVIERAAHGEARLRMAVRDHSLRPGGTVSGPTMFMLADTALFVTVLASIGPQALAVTTSITINFLRKPPPRDLIAECRLMKLGKRLAVGEVTIFSDGEAEAVAHAVGSYAIPARGGAAAGE